MHTVFPEEQPRVRDGRLIHLGRVRLGYPEGLVDCHAELFFKIGDGEDLAGSF